MKAAVLVHKGDARKAFEIRELEMPLPKADEVLIKCEGFGLNYADVMARLGLYKEAPAIPSVIGYDVVGTVEKVGSGIDSAWIGKRVVAMTRFGGYAEYAVSKADGMAEISENTDAAKASALATQGATAVFMAKHLKQLYPGEIALVHAAGGGVGTLLTQMLSKQGVKVIGIVGSDAKKEAVMRNGAMATVNRKTTEYSEEVKRIQGDDRLSISFNAVGGKTFKKDMKLLGTNGMMVLFGASSLTNRKFGFLSQLNFVRQMGLTVPIGLMMTSRSIAGVNMLKIADHKPYILKRCMEESAAMLEDGTIDPMVGGKYLIDQLAEAHTALENGSSQGKLFVKWE